METECSITIDGVLGPSKKMTAIASCWFAFAAPKSAPCEAKCRISYLVLANAGAAIQERGEYHKGHEPPRNDRGSGKPPGCHGTREVSAAEIPWKRSRILRRYWSIMARCSAGTHNVKTRMA